MEPRFLPSPGGNILMTILYITDMTFYHVISILFLVYYFALL